MYKSPLSPRGFLIRVGGGLAVLLVLLGLLYGGEHMKHPAKVGTRPTASTTSTVRPAPKPAPTTPTTQAPQPEVREVVVQGFMDGHTLTGILLPEAKPVIMHLFGLRSYDQGTPDAALAIQHALVVCPAGTLVKVTVHGHDANGHAMVDVQLPDGSDFGLRMLADGYVAQLGQPLASHVTTTTAAPAPTTTTTAAPAPTTTSTAAPSSSSSTVPLP